MEPHTGRVTIDQDNRLMRARSHLIALVDECVMDAKRTRLQTEADVYPLLSCVSMNNERHIDHVPDFSSEAVASDQMLQIDRAVSPSLSCVSMKSEHSMQDHSNFSYNSVVSDQIKGLSEKALKPHALMEWTGNMQEKSPQQKEDRLQNVLSRHKYIMKKKYENVFEGIKIQGNQTLLNRIYTQLYILEGESEGINKEHEVLQMEQKTRKHLQDIPIDCNNIFKLSLELRFEEYGQDQVQKLRTVLTKGIAGIGKTVSVQKFILDWAEGKTNQDIEFMFVLPFRELNLIKDKQYSLHGLLCDFNPELRDLDMNMYNKLKGVFIFDGLDESKIQLNFSKNGKVHMVSTTSSVHVLMTNLIKGDLFPSAHIWITSRPAAANQIPSQYISRVTEIQGFNDSQKEEYFRKGIADQDQAKKIISHIKTTRSLHIMCHIPVFCWISANVFQNIGNAEIPKTLTEMYIYFLLTQTNMKKEKYENSDETDSKELLESNREVIRKLSELAFKQLMKGNVMFYEDDLRECGIDVTEASVYSGICTEIFREESVLYQRKVYCFVHLSFQEFLAAFYVFYCYVNNNKEELIFFKPQYREWSENLTLEVLLEAAVQKALQCETGHLDLFLRFLLGISLESNQKLLKDLLINTQSSSESIKKTISCIKKQIKSEEIDTEVSEIMELWRLVKEKMEQRKCISTEKSINLFLCLSEMKDQSLPKEIQECLKSEKQLGKKLSLGQCSALACMLLTAEEELDELNLKKYNTTEEGYRRLIPAVSNCRKAILSGCNLTTNICELLTSALQSTNSSLKVLDLSNNMLQDSGVEKLSSGLNSSQCKLEILRIVGCNLTTSSCKTIGSTLKSENSSLTELDIRNNNLQDSGLELLSEGLRSLQCKLKILRLDGCNLTKNSCEALCSVLTSANSSLKELSCDSNDLQDSGVEKLSAGLKSSNNKLEILRLVGCNLTMISGEIFCCVLESENSFLKELDLSNNNLQDSGTRFLSNGLKNSTCKLQILKLSQCMITEVGCSSLASALSSNPSNLKELDLTYNNPGEGGVMLLTARLKDQQSRLERLRLAVCNLTVESCKMFALALQSANVSLKELDLSNNDLQDSGVELLSVGLKSSHCKLEILRLSGCMITEKGCSCMASVLSVNPSHLKELDLTYNHPGDRVKLLTDKLDDPQCRLDILSVEHSGKYRITQGFKKYACDLTLDSNTVHTRLSLSERNKKVKCVTEQIAYPDHPERFDWWWQVLCKQSLTGRCYWEAEWSGKIVIALTYKTISRKGDSGDCQFGYNEKSWRLSCSNISYSVWYNKKDTVVPVPPSSSNRVGVYVDCPAGILSFYSISTDTHKLTHLYTFHSAFTEPLYAGFRFYDTESSVSLCDIV